MSEFLIVAEGGPGLVQVLAHPSAAPARCAVCGFAGGLRTDGSKDPRVFIDFAFSLDYYGAVIFCSDCMVNVANSIGYVSAEQAEAMRTQISEQESELITLRELNERLRGVVNSLTNLSDGTLVAESSGIVLDADSGAPVLFKGSESGDFDSQASESAADESVNEPRSNDLPGPTGSFGASGLLDI